MYSAFLASLNPFAVIMDLHYIRRGTGRPLLLVHGIGGSWRSWNTIIEALAAERDVIAVDLPGHGESPQLPGLHSIGTLADALTAFLTRHELLGVDAVGSSMGARLVLELARRGGVLGAVASGCSRRGRSGAATGPQTQQDATTGSRPLQLAISPRIKAGCSRENPAGVRGEMGQTSRYAGIKWCGLITNFLATPLSNSAYPLGASSRLIISTFTAFAICTLSYKMACMSWRV